MLAFSRCPHVSGASRTTAYLVKSFSAILSLKKSIFVQDLFVGAWQQADPAIDQVPFTFPPVHGPSKQGQGKKAKRGAFNKGIRQNGRQFARTRGCGRGFIAREATLLPQESKASKDKSRRLQDQRPAARRAVSAAEYAMALDEEL